MHATRPANACPTAPQPATGPDLFQEPTYRDGLPYALTAGGTLDDEDTDPA